MTDQNNLIYRYTDEQAVEDGVLTPISNLGIMLDNCLIDRVTQNLWEELVKPIARVGEEGELNQVELEAAINELLKGGKPEEGLWVFETNLGTVWAMKNERGRWTLMFPSDY